MKPKLSESSPNDKIYIYYLNGRVEDPANCFGSHFIGNWEEGDTSFLFFSEPAFDQIDAFLSEHPQVSLTDYYCMSYDESHGELV